MKRKTGTGSLESDGCCQFQDVCTGDTTAMARVEISGLIQSDRHAVHYWSGEVCSACLDVLRDKQALCPETASLRIADLAATDWTGATVIGNGAIFAPRRRLAQVAPDVGWVKRIWTRPSVPEAPSSPPPPIPAPTPASMSRPSEPTHMAVPASSYESALLKRQSKRR